MLDEEVKTSGNIYYIQWRLAGQQITQLEQAGRAAIRRSASGVAELQQLYAQRGEEFALAARATVARRGAGGTSLLLCRRPVADRARRCAGKLGEIADAERVALTRADEGDPASSPPRPTG